MPATARKVHPYWSCFDQECQLPYCQVWKEAFAEGYKEGHKEGFKDGHDVGYDRGFDDGVASAGK